MICVVPKLDDRLLTAVLIAQGAEAGSAQRDRSGDNRSDTAPANSQHSEEMSTGEQQNIPWFRSHFFNDSIGSIRDLLWRLTARAAVTEDLPSRAFCPDLDGSATFVLAVVP